MVAFRFFHKIEGPVIAILTPATLPPSMLLLYVPENDMEMYHFLFFLPFWFIHN